MASSPPSLVSCALSVSSATRGSAGTSAERTGQKMLPLLHCCFRGVPRAGSDVEAAGGVA
jgi:hypothetical protein